VLHTIQPSPGKAVPVRQPGRKLHKRMLANRAYLFVFMTNRAVSVIHQQHLWTASQANRDSRIGLGYRAVVLSAKRTEEKTLLRVE